MGNICQTNDKWKVIPIKASIKLYGNYDNIIHSSKKGQEKKKKNRERNSWLKEKRVQQAPCCVCRSELFPDPRVGKSPELIVNPSTLADAVP